jgi:hypothetical protein
MDLCDNRLIEALAKEKEKEKLIRVPNRAMRREAIRKAKKKGK